MILKPIRNALITGIVILLPLGVTFIIINFLVQRLGSPTSNLIFWFIDPAVKSKAWIEPLLDIAATGIVLIAITAFGFLSRYFIGRALVHAAEGILTRLPFVKSIYTTAKQIVQTFSKENKAVFQRVALVEYPRKGVYAIGFLTSTASGEVQRRTTETVVNVFVPTTPNPTSGFLLLIPEDQIIYLDMSVTDGMKLIISGGAVVPQNYESLRDLN